MQPIELGNVILMVVGVGFVIGAGVILYRTGRNLLKPPPIERRSRWWLPSELVNLVIGVVFLIAGVLFVVNNLRGNPLAIAPVKTSLLHLETQTEAKL